MYIDSHCHIHDVGTYQYATGVFKGEARGPAELLRRAEQAGVARVICVGVSHPDSQQAQAFASQHPQVFWSYGIHPDDATTAATAVAVAGAAQEFIAAHREQLVAIGEVGLDYHHGQQTRAAQIRLLEQMLELAQGADLPLIFHVREAFFDFFPVVRNFPGVRGVVHSFSDSPANLQTCLENDFYIGVNGLATYADLPLPPLERTLLETDAPFLAPVPYRGQVNEPAHIPQIAEFVAAKHQRSVAEVAEITTKNTERLFGLN